MGSSALKESHGAIKHFVTFYQLLDTSPHPSIKGSEFFKSLLRDKLKLAGGEIEKEVVDSTCFQ